MVSETLIAISYYFIPIALVFFASKRCKLAYKWMFLMFVWFSAPGR